MPEALKQRFGDHPERHPGLKWAHIEKRLSDHPEAPEILLRMEEIIYG